MIDWIMDLFFKPDVAMIKKRKSFGYEKRGGDDKKKGPVEPEQ